MANRHFRLSTAQIPIATGFVRVVLFGLNGSRLRRVGRGSGGRMGQGQSGGAGRNHSSAASSLDSFGLDAAAGEAPPPSARAASGPVEAP